MAFYVVRTLPKGFKPTGTVALKDLTQELFVTNDEKMAKSSVDGSLKPMVAYHQDGYVVFSNLAKINGALTRQENAWVKAGRAADAAANGVSTIGRIVAGVRRELQKRRQPERQAPKPGPGKGRFDHVKPLRKG